MWKMWKNYQKAEKESNYVTAMRLRKTFTFWVAKDWMLDTLFWAQLSNTEFCMDDKLQIYSTVYFV